jgi:hypothetical protein
MAPTHPAQDFLQEQDFLESMFFVNFRELKPQLANLELRRGFFFYQAAKDWN